ncbi:SagB/ThcOx family dehydrogenase [Candidatus Bathyarchaeota archaeon]|nr:SagB/ThcOx family dehydrogenase [Candidatus Bathyarchaeota archaeon]
MLVGVGDRFQSETKYFRGNLQGGHLDWLNKPKTFKNYPDSITVKLRLPEGTKNLSLEESLKNRRSVRRFASEPINKIQLSYLLWASTGIRRKVGGYEFRTAPSAGALYPIETYLISNNVDGLEKGIYHYSVRSHLLEELKTGDFAQAFAQAALGQELIRESAIVVIWTAIFARSKWKYNQRAYRYVYLDAGHIAQNLALAASSVNLGSCQIGAFFDDEINQLVGVDGKDESALYMSVVGCPILS